MKILLISFSKKKSLKVNKKIIDFLSELDNCFISIDTKFSIFEILFSSGLKNIILFIKSLFDVFGFYKTIKKITKSKKGYYYTLRNCILDQIERETGDLSTKKSSDKFIIKYRLNFAKKAFKLLLFLNFVKFTIKVKKINCIFIPQLDGFPYGGLTALSIKNNLFVGSYSGNKNIAINIRKGLSNERLPLPFDKNLLKNLSDDYLNRAIEEIKQNYILHKDPICSSEQYSQKNLRKDIDFYKSVYKNNKKNILVLLHVFTDQSRIRLENSWYENYLDWFLETIEYCKLNNKVNWFFKGHPHEDYYPINKYFKNLIIKKIKENNFTYIDSKEQFLHGEVSKLASAIVTCTGTCKIEYQALFEMPVISCIGKYSVFEIESQPNTARNQKEYKNLIKNIHNLKLSKNDIRSSKEALLFFKRISGKSQNFDFTVKRFFDKKNEEVFRNY